MDEVGSQIILPRNSINFITAHIIGVNNMGSGIISVKFESVVTNNSAGFVQELSTMETTIKDSIPEGEVWTVSPYDSGSAFRFSYSTVRSGISLIKWLAYVEVASISWT